MQTNTKLAILHILLVIDYQCKDTQIQAITIQY